MNIDAKQLDEVFVYNPRPMFEVDERWYTVPRDNRYALSTSGRLAFSSDGKTGFKILYPSFTNNEDGYIVKWRGNTTQEFISVSALIGEVFFSNVDYYRLIAVISHPKNRRWNCNLNPKMMTEYYSYLVTNCHILYCKDEETDYYISKCNGDKPNYSEHQYKHRFINRDESATHDKVVTDWHNMLQRATSEKRKEYRKDCRDNTVCDEWYDISNFSAWYYHNRYYYSGTYGDLQLDKDLISFGMYPHYSPINCCFLPSQINSICKKSGLSVKTVETMKEFISIETIREEIPTEILDRCREWIYKYYDNEEVIKDE